MGFYINPSDQTKEEWLRDNATSVYLAPLLDRAGPNEHFVCLVDNGGFTAAGIAYNKTELDAFNWEGDKRPKLWCVVDDQRLISICPHVEHMLEAYA